MTNFASADIYDVTRNVFGFTHLEWEDTESAELLQGRADIAHFFVSVLRCRWGNNEVGLFLLHTFCQCMSLHKTLSWYVCKK